MQDLFREDEDRFGEDEDRFGEDEDQGQYQCKPHPPPPPHCDIKEEGLPPLPLHHHDYEPTTQEQQKLDKHIQKALHDYLLSPKCSTEKEQECDSQQNSQQQLLMDFDQIKKLFKDNVENFDNILDRTSTTPVSQFIISTYYNGLPLFQDNKAINQHTTKAFQYIISKVPELSENCRRSFLTRIVDAYTACQMEQARVIDTVYGTLSGRDKSFKDQILNIVDIQKEQVLNQLVNHFNPDAWRTSDDNPEGQIPHIISSYCVKIGPQLGLRGVSSSKMDGNRFSIEDSHAQVLIKGFGRLFTITDLINTIVSDVNQQDDRMERLIILVSLSKWAGDTEANHNFESHSIFYDEDKSADYVGKPNEEKKFLPYLSPAVALKILEHLFLK